MAVLSIRSFPDILLQEAKIQAIRSGQSLREFSIDLFAASLAQPVRRKSRKQRSTVKPEADWTDAKDDCTSVRKATAQAQPAEAVAPGVEPIPLDVSVLDRAAQWSSRLYAADRRRRRSVLQT